MRIVVALIAMISCTVAANLLLKVGAMEPPEQRIVFGLATWRMCLGVVVFGVSLLIYIWVLRVLPLNVAQSFAAAQFIGVILASFLVLSEPISPMRWLGITLISLGILIVGLSRNSAAG
jgi:undecaprenyl phosphate-alpha-L-ara4N flippase subunit ArnE